MTNQNLSKLSSFGLNDEDAIRELLFKYLSHKISDKGAILVMRTFNHIVELQPHIKNAQLNRILSINDESRLLESITNISIEEKYSKNVIDPIEHAELEGIKERNRLMRMKGGVITSEKVASILGITRQGVDKKEIAGRLLAVIITGAKKKLYPVWQFDTTGVVKGFTEVMEHLKHYDPWMKMIFFLTKNPHTNNFMPIDALVKNKLEKVIQAADATSEYGGS